ncbi:MAG: hypothetical protein AAB426_08645, partial [Myxococcota bacterium]
MTSYLQQGWYEGSGRRALRQEVVDGAMDVAGLLWRAQVPASLVGRVAMQVRALMRAADPRMEGGGPMG